MAKRFLRRGQDNQLHELLISESRQLLESGAERQDIIARLLDMVGSRPAALKWRDHNEVRRLRRTSEGLAVIRIMTAAEMAWHERNGSVGMRWRGRNLDVDERALAELTLEDGFSYLSGLEPRLLQSLEEVRRVSKDLRSRDQPESSVQAAVGDIMVAMVTSDHLIGPLSSSETDVLRAPTAIKVVWEYLASVAGISMFGFDQR